MRTRVNSKGHRVPCVNVKLRWKGYGVLTPEDWQAIRDECDAGPDFGPEYLERMDPEVLAHYESDAASDEFTEQAIPDAAALFGSSVTIEWTGRSGGWIEVDGLPEPDYRCTVKGEGEEDADLPDAEFSRLAWDSPEWAAQNLPPIVGSRLEGSAWTAHLTGDADTLRARFEAFEKIAREHVDGIPYQVASSVALNTYQAERAERERAAAVETARDAMRAALDEKSDDQLVRKALALELESFGLTFGASEWAASIARGRKAIGL